MLNAARTGLCFLFGAFSLCILAGMGVAAPPPGAGLSWQREAGAVALLSDGKAVWRFNYSTNLTKSYFHHPSNPRHPTRWYGIMDRSHPFWFLNASLLQLEAYTLPAHQKMLLQYRVHIHPQRWDRARLEQEQDRFVKEAGK